MMDVGHYLSFSETPIFSRQIDGTGSLEVLFAIQQDLYLDPKRGSVIPGTNGARKGRISKGGGQGKRGGFRYIYVYVEEAGKIYLLLLYGKEEQDDLTPDQRKQLGAMIKRIKEGLKK